MTPRDIAERLARQVDDVCHRLLPAGKKVGNEWCVGNVRNAEGESLKVRLTGNKAGVWSDFAEGSKGDLLDLWAACTNRPLRDAIVEAKEYLGIHDDAPRFTRPMHHSPKIDPPNAKPVAESAKAIEWFEKRGISKATLEKYNVTANGTRVSFPCYHGEILKLVKYRDVAKAKKDAFSVSPGADPVLFGWHAIPDNARSIVITEGEIDALSYAEQGIPALSVPFGAGKGDKQKWIENEMDRLEAYDDIFLSMDADREGELALAEIVDRIGRHRCKVVRLPHKDANESHMAGEELAKHIAAAVTLDPAELRCSASYLPEVLEAFAPVDRELAGMPTPWKKVETQLRFRPGETTVWYGINGHGKSMVLDHVCVHGVYLREKWCIASMEMAPPVHLKRLFCQAAGLPYLSPENVREVNAFFDGFVWLFHVFGTAKASRIMSVFEYARKRYGITQFVIDSLAKCGFAEDDYNGQKSFVDAVTDFDREHQCHTHIVCHARKGEDEHSSPGKMDVKGTGAITDMVDNVLAVWRNKYKEDAIAKYEVDKAAQREDEKSEAVKRPAEKILHAPDCIVTCGKQRNYDWEKRIGLWYDRESHQYLEEPSDRPRRYVEFKT